MDLQVPEKKMSTTGGTEQGTVFVLDDPGAIVRKFRSAVTDSGRDILRRPDKPGISNLIEIVAAVRGVSPDAVEKEFAEAPGYAEFKQAVGEAVAEYLAPIRERYGRVRPDEPALEAILADGAAKARAIAAETVALARDRMGMGPPP
jgi:tryptophanyl-tRNA synthetase